MGFNDHFAKQQFLQANVFNNLGPLSPRPFYLDCIIAMRGYDFREGQPFSFRRRLLF
jgi:hypothetical protein